MSEIEINNIYCMDCLDGLKHIPDKTIDLILTDPPYGIGENNKKRLSRGGISNPINYGNFDWDEQRITKDVFIEIMRVSKNQIIFGGNYYIDFLKPSSCWIVWDKDNGKCDFSDCELAWTSFKTAVRKFKWRWHGMFQEKMNWKEKRYHPTQKPLPLFRWIIENYSKEEQLICDPFIGSGTTAIACKQLNRNFIGFEINPEYCKIAEERLKIVPKRLDKFNLVGRGI